MLAIALLVFGRKRLPELGKSLGSGMREFEDSIAGNKHDDKDEAEPAKLEVSASQQHADPSAQLVDGEVVHDEPARRG